MMTDVRQLDEQVLRDLAHRPVSAPCVSFYLPPTRGSIGRQAANESLRMLQRHAADMLTGAPWELSDAATAELIEPAVAQLASIERQPYEGLACFVDADGCHTVVVPGPTPTTVTVAAEPDLLPLVTALGTQFDFDLLILSQRHVQLFRCTANELEPMTRYDLPANLDDALATDLNETNATPLDRGSTYKEERKEAVERFVQIVERRLPPSVREGRRPLVVAAIDFEAAVFAKASSHPMLVKLTDLGSPEHLSASKVHEAAVALIAQRAQASAEGVRDRFSELDGTGRTAREPDDVRQAADEGRVDTLLVAPEVAEARASELAAVVKATLRTGGRVMTVSPTSNGEPSIAAILRY